jgi:hypothetical protein
LLDFIPENSRKEATEVSDLARTDFAAPAEEPSGF